MSNFGRTVAWVVGAMFLLTIGAGAIAMSRGPQQQGISFDSEALTQAGGERILLKGNQALAPSSVDAVVIEPAAGFRARVEGATLVIELTQTLRYQQEYRISVGGVRGVATPATADWTATVTTADGTLLFTQPTEQGIDILRTSTSDVRIETVVRSVVSDPGAEVTALLDLGTAAAIVSSLPDGGSALTIAPLDGSPPNTARLPVRGWVSGLDYDPLEARLEFDVTPVDAGELGGGGSAGGELAGGELAGGAAGDDGVGGVERWFVSTSNTLAAERVGGAGEAPVDVDVDVDVDVGAGAGGDGGEVVGSGGDGTDGDGDVGVGGIVGGGGGTGAGGDGDGSTGTDGAGSTGTDGAHAGTGGTSESGALHPSPHGPSTGSRLESALQAVGNQVVDRSGNVVYTPADAGQRITAVCPSLNGQVAAVRLEPSGDDQTTTTEAATYVVFAVDGTSVRSINATAVSWCGDFSRG